MRQVRHAALLEQLEERAYCSAMGPKTPAIGPIRPDPAPNPIVITTRFGNELVISGTSGNDSILVRQAGATLTIIGNGVTSTAPAPAAGLFIYSGQGTDTITVDSSVTLRTTIETIDNAATTVTSAGSNVSVWIDATDTFTGTGTLHRIASYANGVTKDSGFNVPDPTDTGAITRHVASLWGTGPVMADVNQGFLSDCYYLSTFAALANSSPATLREMAVDLGDGSYAVQFVRNGTDYYVREDADFAAGPYAGFAFAHPGASGAIWMPVMEKAYAYYRTTANTYSSLNGGWMGTVFSDVGVANAWLTVGTNATTFYTTVSTALSSGRAVTLATGGTPPDLVGSHAYTVVSVSGSGPTALYRVRNPWGISGDPLEDANGYAILTFAQMAANFTVGGTLML